jgi:transposase
MAYDEKYRKRAVEYRMEGHTIEETVKTFKICASSLREWTKKYKETGEIKNKVLTRKHKKIDPAELEAYMEKHPDAYLSEIAKVFGCWPSAVEKALKKLKITRKKKRSDTKNKTLKK